MPKLNLTQAAVDKLPTPPANTVYWDAGLSGFGIRVSPKGRKTFIAQYRVAGGREVVETIGTTAVLPRVADARERARHSMLLARQGTNPVEARRQRQVADKAAVAAKALSFGKVVEHYAREHLAVNCKPRSAAEITRLLGRASRFFANKPVSEISKGDVLDLLAQSSVKIHPRAASAGGLSEATNLLKVVRRAFRWALAHDLTTADPTLGVVKPLTRTATRERTLDNDEIVRFWHGCEQLGYPFGPLFQLLLLTGQRRREVGELSWGEIDPDSPVWHLPKERTKNSRAHDVHLSDAALAVINGLPRIVPMRGKPPWLFSMTGERPVEGYSPAQARLARAMGVSDWSLHDLRRTATTIMARCGVAPHVADRVLNHTGGTIRGVAAVYNRFDYATERAAALNRLGQFVMGLVNPEMTQGKVVALRSAPLSG